MQILEIGTRHDHTVQQLLHLILRFALDIQDLLHVPKPRSRLEQKRPQRPHIPPAQDAAKLGDVGWLARHNLGDPERTRTSCLRFRKSTLCPDELRGRSRPYFTQSWRLRARCSAVLRRQRRKPVWSSRPSKEATTQSMSRSQNSSVSACACGNVFTEIKTVAL